MKPLQLWLQTTPRIFFFFLPLCLQTLQIFDLLRQIWENSLWKLHQFWNLIRLYFEHFNKKNNSSSTIILQDKTYKCSPCCNSGETSFNSSQHLMHTKSTIPPSYLFEDLYSVLIFNYWLIDSQVTKSLFESCNDTSTVYHPIDTNEENDDDELDIDNGVALDIFSSEFLIHLNKSSSRSKTQPKTCISQTIFNLNFKLLLIP